MIPEEWTEEWKGKEEEEEETEEEEEEAAEEAAEKEEEEEEQQPLQGGKDKAEANKRALSNNSTSSTERWMGGRPRSLPLGQPLLRRLR